MARESKVAMAARAGKIVQRLLKKYPNPKTALNHSNPLELLAATILSAQTTDVGVNRVTPALFAKYKTAADYAAADTAQMEAIVKPTGFYHNKTKSLQAMGKTLVERFGGQVPDQMEGLLSLPGVARKTANVVLGNAFHKAVGIVVDRHVTRLATRLGLTANVDPVKIEQDLMKLIPQKHWIDFSHLLINHGRQTCTARKPNCPSCVLNDICPLAFKVK
jgi:endonuclease-3